MRGPDRSNAVSTDQLDHLTGDLGRVWRAALQPWKTTSREGDLGVHQTG
ncbi:hypothetical protein SAMN05216360_111216 [Methylobacterium phyllostachyos]|uniref:Uncharacterized protein n=1 Tax=Methylobacterium phyllostachyos TaxID=582672 RepID=A0A1H0EKD7_9HYPH|nr:hypothetical protein SAMN05216360_111216 [Methylobacterium phyllostachyos]